MHKISNIISMPIISIYESQYCGIVYNVLIDYKYKKIKYISILNENDNIPRIIAIDNLYKIGNDCIFIKNQENLSLQINYEEELKKYYNPINLIAYDFSGKYLGVVNDATFNSKNRIDEFIINNKSYKINEILNVGNSAIIVNNNKIDLKKFKPKEKVIKPTINLNEKVIALSPIINNKESSFDESKGNKIITDFRFLTGRKLNKDVIAINGEIIAKSGSCITKEIINKASFYGKLVEIARYSTK